VLCSVEEEKVDERFVIPHLFENVPRAQAEAEPAVRGRVAGQGEEAAQRRLERARGGGWLGADRQLLEGVPAMRGWG
jgi:hypothetical protein